MKIRSLFFQKNIGFLDKQEAAQDTVCQGLRIHDENRSRTACPILDPRMLLDARTTFFFFFPLEHWHSLAEHKSTIFVVKRDLAALGKANTPLWTFFSRWKSKCTLQTDMNRSVAEFFLSQGCNHHAPQWVKLYWISTLLLQPTTPVSTCLSLSMQASFYKANYVYQFEWFLSSKCTRLHDTITGMSVLLFTISHILLSEWVCTPVHVGLCCWPMPKCRLQLLGLAKPKRLWKARPRTRPSEPYGTKS